MAEQRSLDRGGARCPRRGTGDRDTGGATQALLIQRDHGGGPGERIVRGLILQLLIRGASQCGREREAKRGNHLTRLQGGRERVNEEVVGRDSARPVGTLSENLAF